MVCNTYFNFRVTVITVKTLWIETWLFLSQMTNFRPPQIDMRSFWNWRQRYFSKQTCWNLQSFFPADLLGEGSDKDGLTGPWSSSSSPGGCFLFLHKRKRLDCFDMSSAGNFLYTRKTSENAEYNLFRSYSISNTLFFFLEDICWSIFSVKAAQEVTNAKNLRFKNVKCKKFK